MFARRTVQIRIVKTDPTLSELDNKTPIKPEHLARVAQDTILFFAIVYVGIRSAETLLSTTKEIAIITAKSKFN